MQCSQGHSIPEGSAYCPTCGAAAPAVAPATWPSSTQVPAAVATNYPVAPPNYPAVPAVAMQVAAPGTAARGMYTAAAVINWVVLGLVIIGTLGIGVIAAAWFVPMTIQMHKGAKGPYKHTALGVCTLLFCNLISGILLLVDDSGRPDKPRY